MPSIGIQADVSVEATGGCVVRREVRQASFDVGPKQVHAVVAEEHSIAVHLVARSQIGGGLGRPDLDASAERREVSGQRLSHPPGGGRVEPYG